MTELRIPEVGESISEAQIGRWLKEPGQPVAKDEPVVELETDKVTVELPAPAAGVLGPPLKQPGETAKVGELIGTIQEAGAVPGAGATPGAGAAAAPASDRPVPAPAPAPNGGAARRLVETEPQQRRGPAAPEAEADEDSDDQAPAPPAERAAPADTVAGSMRRVAEPAPPRHERPEAAPPPAPRTPVYRVGDEHGFGPQRVEAARPGEVEAEDAIAPAPARPAAVEGAAPAPAPAPGGAGRAEEVVPLSPIRRRIAQRLVQAQQTAALLTTFNEADLSAVLALRAQFQPVFQQRYGIKLGLMSFFVKAAIDALRRFRALNAEIRGDTIVYRDYYDLGIAISTERGLVAPVLRDAQRLSFAEIELAIADFANRARAGRLKLVELEGGTFTITNGGVFGSLLSTPIVNPPQSGVLGMHTIQKRPVVRADQIVIRPMMYVALTYDHRLVDGREAVGFLKRLVEAIEEPARMLVEV